MILEESFANRLLTTSAQRAVALCVLVLISCGVGCASSGTIQPHQAFRQAPTPYQGYYQGQQASFGAAGSGTTATGDYAGYGGYNNNVPDYGQSNAATGSYGAYGNQFASPYSPPGNLNVGQVPTQGAYQQYYNGAGYNHQPSYNTGFTSGSC